MSQILNNKKIIIINGAGGSGKDAFVEIARNKFKQFNIFNFSSIDPIKEILLKEHGWDGQNKDNYWRIKMVELKQKSIKENDLPTKYLLEKINQAGPGVIFFAHQRTFRN